MLEDLEHRIKNDRVELLPVSYCKYQVNLNGQLRRRLFPRPQKQVPDQIRQVRPSPRRHLKIQTPQHHQTPILRSLSQRQSQEMSLRTFHSL